MPLTKGKSKKAIQKNIHELMTGSVGASRKKAIATMAKRRGISKAKARQMMSVAIAMSKAGKSRRG